MRHTGPISGIASYGEQYIATAGYDNQVILWDSRQGVPIMRGLHDHLANQCSFSPDGRYLVSSSSDYTARLWSVPEMKLCALFRGHEDDVEMCTFHSEGQMVATCSRDCSIRTFKTDGTPVAVLIGHESDVISVVWSGDDVVSSSDDGTIRRWNGLTGELLETFDLGGVETDTIVVATDGTIFAGNDDGEILTISKSAIARTSAHMAGIKRLSYTAEYQLLASLSYDRTLAIWRIGKDGTLTKVQGTTFPSVVWPRSTSFLGRERLVFGTFGSTFATYVLTTDAWEIEGIAPYLSLNSVTCHGGTVHTIGDSGTLYSDLKPASEVGSLCNFLLPLGSMILTGGQLGIVYDALTATKIHQHRSPLNTGTAYMHDGVAHAIVGTYTGEGLIFRMPSPAEIEFVGEVRLSDNAIKGVACADGIIFAVSATGEATFLCASDLSVLRVVENGHNRIANGCAPLPGGRFASVSRDLKLRIWDLEGVMCYDTPHRNSIKCVAASADGQYVASGSYGGQIAVFDTEAREWVKVVRPTAAGISSLSFCDRRGEFAASSYDGTVYWVAAR